MSHIDGGAGFIPPALDELNQGLPGYEVVELIACGGMGAVYRARQISLDRMVAIKILPPELAVDETFRQSFEAEGKAMAKVSHSNLVGVYDFGKVSDMLYLVIEFVEGSNLYESMGDSAVDTEVSVTLISSVAAGLAEAHRNGLVHRDIKPANILINMDLVPKLGDFGLAVPDSDIESGLMMGTPAYLAPEVLENPTSASFASDTYALGVILYEMLTGSSIERGDVMDLSLVPAMGDLPKILRKSVDPKPLLRYQTGECFEDALKDWLRKPKSAGLTASPVSPIRPVIRPNVAPVVTTGSSGGVGGLLVGLFCLLVVGGLAWMMLGGGSDSDDTISDSTPLSADEPQAAEGEPAVDLEKVLKDLRRTQRQAIEELSSKIMGERSQNRGDLLAVAGVEGDAFMKSGSKDREGIPRYFFPGEVDVSEGLLVHLRKFGKNRQGELDRKFDREMTSLHRESLRDLRAAKVEFPRDVNDSWEMWGEWLGLNPLKMMHRSLGGLWTLSPSTKGFELHVSASGRVIIIQGGERFEDAVSLETSETGELTLRHSGDTASGFPWKLRWLGNRLEGEDSNGGSRRLRFKYFDYRDLLKKEVDRGAPSVVTPETKPEDEVPQMLTFQDAEVAVLTEGYRKALVSKIEPLETGYLRILEGYKVNSEKPLEEEGVEQIEEEVKRVGNLNWRGGFTLLETVSKAGKLPDEVAKKQSVFQSEFKKRFEPIQKTYLQALQEMLRQREGEGRADVGDIKKAIEKLEVPEGAVTARYVKLVSLADGDLSHTTVAKIEVLDLEGENLPNAKFSDIKVSSFSVNGEGKKAGGEQALDGDPKTNWHSKYKGGKDEFPHWISFDLGQDHLISGFSITPRSYWKNRKTGLTNWVFYVSPDGENWTSVAKGNFPRGDGLKKHLGFARSE